MAPFEGGAVVVHTGRVPLAPLGKGLAKVLGRHDMFPLQVRGSVWFAFGLVAAGGEVDHGVTVGAATREGGRVSGGDLRGQLLGLGKGGNTRILSVGEARSGEGKNRGQGDHHRPYAEPAVGLWSAYLHAPSERGDVVVWCAERLPCASRPAC
jgi:hypothetical protein